MELAGVVSISLEMTADHGLEAFALDIRPGKTTAVEQHFLNVASEGIPVPDAEMEGFVSPEKGAFEAEWRESMVKPGEPLRHAHVIRVLRFE